MRYILRTRWIQDFRSGSHWFSPLHQYRFMDECIQSWCYLDRLIIHLILKLIQPTFKYFLIDTERRYWGARKRLFKILRTLRLTISSHKTRMGKLTFGFHFLGVDFEVPRSLQKKTQVKATLRPRTCCRALHKVKR